MAVDENKLHTQRTQGVIASRELRITDEAFKALREQYIKAWENSDPRDTAGREKIWTATTILSQVQGHLKACVDNGKVAEREIEAIKHAGESKRPKLSEIRTTK